jgi:hypothetical protein
MISLWKHGVAIARALACKGNGNPAHTNWPVLFFVLDEVFQGRPRLDLIESGVILHFLYSFFSAWMYMCSVQITKHAKLFTKNTHKTHHLLAMFNFRCLDNFHTRCLIANCVTTPAEALLGIICQWSFHYGARIKSECSNSQNFARF